MFTTPEYVKVITGYDVTPEQVKISQGLIETLVGRVEELVYDANDRAILGNAVAYQAVYMSTNSKVIFEQAAIIAGSSGDAATSFDVRMKSPYFAPLAVIACRGLSWLRSRSVKVGPHSRSTRHSSWETE